LPAEISEITECHLIARYCPRCLLDNTSTALSPPSQLSKSFTRVSFFLHYRTTFTTLSLFKCYTDSLWLHLVCYCVFRRESLINQCSDLSCQCAPKSSLRTDTIGRTLQKPRVLLLGNSKLSLICDFSVKVSNL
jgi:hypothetical protein